MMRFRTLLPLLALAVALQAAPTFADGFIILQPPPDQPNWRGVPLAVNFHHVDVKIDNQVATTSVEQEFRNPNNIQIEGLYIFPLPAAASVSNFSMWIDGKEMPAELLEREKASQIYEDIVRKTRDPALLEYMGTKLFKLRIFPINPNENKKVRLEYSEVLTNDTGLVTYRYPLNTEKFSSAPLNSVVVKTEIASQTEIRNVFSPSHDVDVARQNDHKVVVSYERNNIKPDRDFILYYTLSNEDVGLNLVTFQRTGEDGYFMLLANPGAEPAEGAAAPISKDVIFVADVSGSMVEGDKIAQAKKALQFCVSSLNAGDRFNVIAFSTEARSFGEGMLTADATNKEKAVAWIEALKARGGTNIDDALQMALKLGTNTPERPMMLVFMTDGQPTIGPSTNPDEILKKFQDANKSNVRVFSLGVGYDVNTVLLDRLAEGNKGTREYVTPEENLELKVSNFYAKLSNPVLSDLKLAIDGLETYDVYPKSLPDLFRGSQMVVFGRYKGTGHHAVRLAGQVSGKPREYVYEANFGGGDASRAAMPRLWAIRKIGFLLDAIRLHGDNPELKSEVVALAKEFGIITPYTSFLVLEDSMRPGAPGASAPAEQAMRGLDERMRREVDKAKESLGAVSGENAVGASQSVKNLAEGDNEESILAGGFWAGRKGLERGGAEDKKQGGIDDLVRTVGDRTFYNVNGVWTDSRVKGDDPAKRTKIQYMSDSFFDVLKTVPELAPFLALGTRVVVDIGGMVYEITE